MKKNLTLFWLIISSILGNLSDLAANETKIILDTPIYEEGIQLIINNNETTEAYTEEAMINGTNCRYIMKGKYAYFKVDDNMISKTSSNLILKIRYFDDGFGHFYFHYNSTTTNYQKITIHKTNTHNWITLTAAITDAAFDNAQNNQSDCRISGECYIQQVEISEGELIPDNESVPITSGSGYSEFMGKSVAGYQAWFRAVDDETGWVHWPYGSQNRPAPGNSSFEVFPYMEDYPEDKRISTNFEPLGNGEAATLFNSPDVIDIHFNWMKEYGIEGVALQRFIGDSPYPIVESSEAIPSKVKTEAERTKRIFYICYDMSSGKDEDAWVESIKFDWVYNIEQAYALTSSPSYATVDNKPVVQIWGTGFTTRVGNASKTIELIEFLQGRGCYVIGGVPTGWRTENRDSKPDFLEAYKRYDMLSPWTPGRYRNSDDIDNHTKDYWQQDKAFCDANGIDYMPVAFPGFAWATWKYSAPNSIPRSNGEFLWHQAFNIKNAGIDQLYFAMFDEYDEGTAIMKGASDWTQIPTDQYFLTYSTDGYWLSSDFYLRLAGNITQMLKDNQTPTSSVPVSHSAGPVYYRNSFEKRSLSYQEKEDGPVLSGLYNLDPCFKNPSQIVAENVTNARCLIHKNPEQARSGEYHVLFDGNPKSTTNAVYSYKIADVKIKVAEDMQISFWKKTINHLGRYTNLDLEFKSGKKLSAMTEFKNNYGKDMHPSNGIGIVNGGWTNIQCLIGKGELIGDEITQITLNYNRPNDNTPFEALFDDIIIATNLPDYDPNTSINDMRKETRIFSKNNFIYFEGFSPTSQICIYNINGQVVHKARLSSNSIINPGLSGLYLIVVENQNNRYTQKIVF